MTTRIFITGCAKSGTTLLLRLFNYFDNILVLTSGDSNEVTLERLIKCEYEGVIVGKRKWNYILSEVLHDDILKKQEKLILDNDIKVLNIVRDGRDVILSDNKYVPPKRWIHCVKQREELKGIIHLEVRYEDIIYKPDEVQKEIGSSFNLKNKQKFSEYPTGLANEIFNKKGGNLYKARPITDVSIHKNLTAYKNICNDKELPEFEKLLKELNYK